MPYIQIATLEQVPSGQKLEVTIGQHELLICNHRDEIYAIENRCPHQDRELTDARMKNGRIICPFHGYAFRLGDGKGEMANCQLKVYPVTCDNGIIKVNLITTDDEYLETL